LPFNDYVDIFELIEKIIEGLKLPKDNWKFAYDLLKMSLAGTHLPGDSGSELDKFIEVYTFEKRIYLSSEPVWMQDHITTFLKGRDYYFQTVEFCKKINEVGDVLSKIPEDTLANDLIWGVSYIPHSTRDILFLAEQPETGVLEWVSALWNGWNDTGYHKFPIIKSHNLYRCLDTGLVATMLDIDDFTFTVTDKDGVLQNFGWKLFKPANGGTSISNIFCMTFPGITMVETEKIPGLEFPNPFKLFLNNEIRKDDFRANAIACLNSKHFAEAKEMLNAEGVLAQNEQQKEQPLKICDNFDFVNRIEVDGFKFHNILR
jgi:hypothetical protein